MLLNKESIKNISRKTKIVKVKGYEVKLIELTIPQQLELEKLIADKNSNSSLLSPMLQFSVVDENNNPVFDDEDVKNLPASLASEIFKECVSFNAMDDDKLDEHAKN